MTGTGLCAYVAARIFDGEGWHEDAALLVERGTVRTIASIRDIPQDAQRIDLGGGTLAPGLVDLQVNGGGGVFFTERRSAAALRHICMTHIGLGTTALLPALVSSPRPHQAEAVSAAREAYGAMTPGFAGLHLEGPHLSPARRGAHDPSCLRVMDDADAEALIAARSDLPALLVTSPRKWPPIPASRPSCAGRSNGQPRAQRGQRPRGAGGHRGRGDARHPSVQRHGPDIGPRPRSCRRRASQRGLGGRDRRWHPS